MATPIIPKAGYAFKHKKTDALALMLFLGSGDSIDNYEEITKEEYEKIKSNQDSVCEELISDVV